MLGLKFFSLLAVSSCIADSKGALLLAMMKEVALCLLVGTLAVAGVFTSPKEGIDVSFLPYYPMSVLTVCVCPHLLFRTCIFTDPYLSPSQKQISSTDFYSLPITSFVSVSYNLSLPILKN